MDFASLSHFLEICFFNNNANLKKSSISHSFCTIGGRRLNSFALFYISIFVIVKLFQFITKNKKSSDVLLSQAVSHQVPSALKGLTSVFGMGTGVSPSLLSLDLSALFKHILFFKVYTLKTTQRIPGQALDLLVSLSLKHCCSYTYDLSTS